MLKKIFASLTLTFSLFFAAYGASFATEGLYNLTNTVGGPARCAGMAVLMSDFDYQLLLTCRDLKYPISSGAFQYGVWVTNANTAEPQFLGALGVGKRLYEVEGSFSEIFVTEERSSSPKEPSASIIMRGAPEGIPLLNDPTSVPTPVPTPAITPVPEAADDGFGAFTQETNDNNRQQRQTQSNGNASAFAALRIVGGIIIVVVLIVIVIALVSAMRRKPIDL